MAAKKQENPQTPTGPANDDSLSPENYMKNNQFAGGVFSSGETGVSSDFIPAPRKEYPQTAGRTQAGVINPDGTVDPFYDLSTKPGELLGTLDEVSRAKLTRQLYSRGWYAGEKPGGGLADSDKRAVRNLLYYANIQGVDYKSVLSTVSKAPIQEPGGTGRVQVASKDDLIEIANRSALSTIGRKLSETEAQQFAAAYQGVQRSSASSSESAPSADVFFQNRIQQKYGTESDGYKYLSAIGNVAKLLESI